MTRFELQRHDDLHHTFYIIRNLDTMKWFAGYDEMGGAIMTDDVTDSEQMGREAFDILTDLVDAE